MSGDSRYSAWPASVLPPPPELHRRRILASEPLACPAQLASAQLMPRCQSRTAPEGAPGGTGGHRINVRILLSTWSPLTESNRRPSPYHGSLTVRRRISNMGHCALHLRFSGLEGSLRVPASVAVVTTIVPTWG